MALKIKKPVEEWLNEVDYEFMGYMPQEEAFKFVNFIKAVNDGAEENETPLVHLKMMDSVFNEERRCAILCHRGIGKTTVFAEYLILYIACFGYFPGFGETNLILYVTDSIENGVKNLRRNVEYRYQESAFVQKMIPNQKITVGTDGAGFVDLDTYEEQAAGGRKFTDIRLEFMNIKGHRTIVKGYGAKALSLDSRLYTDDGYTTIGDCKVGDRIFGADGELCTITRKSEVFHKPMYNIELMDGRSIKVSEDHINSVVVKENPHNTATYTKKDLLTKELLELPLYLERNRGTYISKENLLFIENCKALEYTSKDFPLNPYVLGLLLGDGSLKKDGSCVLHAHKDDMKEYMAWLEQYELGSRYVDKRNTNVVSQAIKGLSKIIRDLGVNVHGDIKFIPEMYKLGSYSQRKDLLCGLMDTDGTISDKGRMSFCSNSERLARDTMDLVRSLGGTASIRQDGRAFKVEIKINSNIFMLNRKRARFNPSRVKHTRVGIKAITRIEDEPSQCIAVDNLERQFITDNYVRTHNTGVRGAKELGKRPSVAILDDLVSDEDARSDTVIDTIENTVYKAVSKALHPTKQKMIWLGTPFNAKDPLYKAVESGAWVVSVYPVCEKFPVSEEEFRGSWEDRFTYQYVKDEYEEAQALKKPENFNQELMLRIMSDEDRLIQNGEWHEYEVKSVMSKPHAYNFYITTDFATTAKKGADYSVISVWAYNNNGDWLLVDGICETQLMDKNIDDLFRLVARYKPLSVGIEVTGQQGGFVSWIEKEMLNRNVFFNMASSNNSNLPGIRPVTDKLSRFNQVLPLFKQKKFWFPKEMMGSAYWNELMDELTNVSKKGFKSKHDDVCDTISMLSEMDPILPGEEVHMEKNSDGFWSAYTEDKESFTSSVVF